MSMDDSRSPAVTIEAEVNIDNRKWFGLFNFTHNKGRFRKWYEQKKKSNRSNKQQRHRPNWRNNTGTRRARKKVFFFEDLFLLT